MILVTLGYFLATWAMTVNRFFSGVVRIQKDRRHTVVSDGPYRYVCHPSYAGGILSELASALALGSLLALIPTVLTVCLIVLRTALEDKALRNELDGYEEYAQRVRYRLLPGVW
jgi:protein-S-isoprenylcysteine O-methyltransferase Ste14